MKRIGILGGMTWESTALYYRLLNEGVRERLGGWSAADLVVRSIDFALVERIQAKADWKALERLLVAAGRDLAAAGAELVVMASSTAHVAADGLQKSLPVPFLHIADAATEVIKRSKFERVALLGTEYTMTLGAYRDRLAAAGVSVMIPRDAQRREIDRMIMSELSCGIVPAGTKDKLLGIIDELAHEGAQGIVMGCTELALRVNQVECTVPIFDTGEIHVHAALDRALAT